MKHLRLIIALSVALLVAVGVFAYVAYGKNLVAQGVSTDLRPGQPCDRTSPNPCPAP